MTDHSTVSVTMNIAPESTEGTAATTGYKAVPSMMIDSDMEGNFNSYRPRGNKFNTIVIMGKEWMQGKVSGPLTYGEIIYPLCSIFKNVAGVLSDTAAYTYTIAPSSTSADTSKSYTLEWGDSNSNNFQVPGLFFNEFEIKVSRERAEIGGTVIGRLLGVNQSGVLHSSTAIENVPVSPAKIDLYYALAASGGALTSPVQMARGFEFNFKISKRFATFWPVDSTQTSFAGRVEDVPDATLSLRLGADTSGTDFTNPITLARMRAGTTVFFRLVCTGGLIPGASVTNYSFVLNCAVKVSKALKFEDIDGALLGLGWDFTLVHDTGLGGALTCVVVNGTASL